jgi:hypothetical protein
VFGDCGWGKSQYFHNLTQAQGAIRQKHQGSQTGFVGQGLGDGNDSFKVVILL